MENRISFPEIPGSFHRGRSTNFKEIQVTHELHDFDGSLFKDFEPLAWIQGKDNEFEGFVTTRNRNKSCADNFHHRRGGWNGLGRSQPRGPCFRPRETGTKWKLTFSD